MDELIGSLGRWASGRGPLYLLLAVRLRALIDDGILPPGTPLPPDRALARRLAVGRGTVIAAYELLQQEGKLVRRQGSGTRVARSGLPATRSTTDGVSNPLLMHILDRPDGVTLLSCAAPLEPPPELAEAYQEAAVRLARIRDDIGYHPAGHSALRSALAAYYSARGLPTSPDEIIVTNGGQQAITLITNLLVSPGDVVRAEVPTYPGATEIFRNAGALIETHEAGTVPAGGGRLAYVIPTAHNPTGAVMPGPVRRRLAAWATANDVPLIDDEVPAELCFDGVTPPPLAAYGRGEHILTVGSLSKLVWGGIRVGWVRAAAPVISRLARLRAIHDLGGDIVAQLAAAGLLARLDPVRLSRTAVLKARHDHLCAQLRERLPEWSFEPALGGQTLWIRLPRGDAGAFAQVTARHGVAVPPGPAFDPAGGHEACLRLPFLRPETELTEAVTRLAAAWHEYDGTRRPAALHAFVV
jgi:DNA-binding transcriptional MocR family regulator